MNVSNRNGESRMDRPDHILAHKNCYDHKEEILKSKKCGCFYCLAIFKPNEIEEWIDQGKSALCPKCGIDSVIGGESGYPITKRFLKKMKKYWFSVSS